MIQSLYSSALLYPNIVEACYMVVPTETTLRNKTGFQNSALLHLFIYLQSILDRRPVHLPHSPPFSNR